MLKYFIILTLALLRNLLLLGHLNNSTDYLVYSSLIKSEVISKTKSVTIIEKLKNDTTSISWITESIKSKDLQKLEQLRFLTRDENGNSIKVIDTTTQNLILTFCQTKPKDYVLQNVFTISNVKVFLIDKFPIKNGSETEWKRFYKKYSDSGGIFQFSNICYSQDDKEAIFYHSLSRHGLNAHGALTIMQNINGEWKIKYHITFWQA